MLDRTKVRVISGAFPGEQRVQRMMKIVAPLRVQRKAAALARRQHLGVVQVAFADENFRFASALCEFLHRFFQFRQHVVRAEIADAVDSIEAQTVQVIVFEPVKRVGDKEIANRPAVPPVEIQRLAPRRGIALGKIAPKLAEIIAFRAEMVVDHVQDNGQSAAMCGIDQTLQTGRPAVGILRRVKIHAVIAPVASAGELRDGHDFDDRHAELGQFVEVRNDAIEGALRRIGADVQLVDHRGGQVKALPSLIRPRKRREVDGLRRAVNAVRLATGSRIGPLFEMLRGICEAIKVGGARRKRGNVQLPIAVGI